MSLTKCTDDLMMINNHLIECVEGSGPVTPFYTDPVDGAVYWTYFDGTGYGANFQDVPLVGTDVLTGTGYNTFITSPFNKALDTYGRYGYAKEENTLSFTDLSYFGPERTVSSIFEMNKSSTNHTMTTLINFFDIKVTITMETSTSVRISVEPNYSTIVLSDCKGLNGWVMDRKNPILRDTHRKSKLIYDHWFRLTYTYSDGVLRIFYNNDLVGYFRCTLTGNKNLTTSITTTIYNVDEVASHMTEMFINSKDLSKGHVQDLRFEYNPEGGTGQYSGRLPSSLLWHD